VKSAGKMAGEETDTWCCSTTCNTPRIHLALLSLWSQPGVRPLPPSLQHGSSFCFFCVGPQHHLPLLRVGDWCQLQALPLNSVS
jgi:hypothetical protein